MANSKISELANAVLPLGDNDVFPIVQNNETRKVQFSALRGLALAKVTSTVNLNYYTNAGVYEVVGNSGHSNTPVTSSDSFALVVLRAVGRGSDYDSIIQLYFKRNDIYSRCQNTYDESWSQWKNLTQQGGTNYVTLNTQQTITAPKTFTAYCDFKAGAGNSGSDMRYKENVKPLENVLDKLLKLDIIDYLWNKQGEEKRDTFGLNATQVKDLFPKMCHTRDDEDKTEWIEYDRCGVIALKAIQEMSAKIQELEEEISKLKQQNSVLL